MRHYFVFAALTALIFVPGLRAHPAASRVQNRLLLVFDTSSEMKKRLPAEERAVNVLSYTLYGQFQPGDSIGVWTFSHNLHTGEFPLEQWDSDQMPALESNIMAFVKSQRYSKTTSFDDMPPTLDDVVRHSERLTTMIFCDGEGQITGTPNDDAINTVFRKNEEKMKKAREPFVIVLRSQLGKFVGCTISSADAIQLPKFPPLPPPPKPVVVPAPAPARPPSTPSPLVIIGTHVGTNVPPPAPAPAPAPATPAQPAPAKTQEVHPSQAPAPVPAPPPVEANSQTPSNTVAMMSPAPIEPPASPVPAINPGLQTAAPIPPAAAAQATAPEPRATPATPLNLDATNNSGMSKPALFAMGAGLLLAASLLVWFIVRLLRRRESPSLITESLKKN